MVWPAVIAAGASLAGGAMSFFGGQSAQASQAALAREQMATQADLQRELATRNEYLQQLFASNQLQWRAQDARNAGIHPLFAMGAQPMSAAGLGGSISPPGLPTASGHEAWQQMGQDVGRAVLAHADHEERKAATALATQQLALTQERQAAEIDLTRAQTAVAISQARRLNGQVGPPFPTPGGTSPGGGRSGDVVVGRLGKFESDPVKVATTNPNDVGTMAGPGQPVTQYGWQNGVLMPFPNNQLIQDQEVTNPLMIRYLYNEYMPAWLGHMQREQIQAISSAIKSAFPNSVGFEFSRVRGGYVPIFKNTGMTPFEFGPSPGSRGGSAVGRPGPRNYGHGWRGPN